MNRAVLFQKGTPSWSKMAKSEEIANLLPFKSYIIVIRKPAEDQKLDLAYLCYSKQYRKRNFTTPNHARQNLLGDWIKQTRYFCIFIRCI